VDHSPDRGYGLMIRLIISRSSEPPPLPEVCISLTVSTGRAYLRLWRLCFIITDELINWRPSQCLAFSAFTQKLVFGRRTAKFQPIWIKFCTHLLLYGIHLWADWDRDRRVGGSRPNQNDYVFVILVTHPKSYIETTDRRDFGGKPSKWRWERVLSWKIPEFCSVGGARSKTAFFRVFKVFFDCPGHSLQKTVLPQTNGTDGKPRLWRCAFC